MSFLGFHKAIKRLLPLTQKCASSNRVAIGMGGGGVGEFNMIQYDEFFISATKCQSLDHNQLLLLPGLFLIGAKSYALWHCTRYIRMTCIVPIITVHTEMAQKRDGADLFESAVTIHYLHDRVMLRDGTWYMHFLQVNTPSCSHSNFINL